MCGFAGCFHPTAPGAACMRETTRMAEVLTHRGPDSDGCYHDDHAALGFRRLSIVDLEGGEQPFYSEDGQVVLVCNGEIYNHDALRAELSARGHHFRSRCDVEVIVHLYEEYGEGLLDRLDGQFAFALYDRRRRRLLLARDHFGIAPLFYATAGEMWLFASEAKALLAHPAVPRALDLGGLDQVLSFPGLVGTRTLFQGVKSIPPGHYVSVTPEGSVTRQYWDLDYPRVGEAAYDRPEQYYVDGLRERLFASVRARLQADVPVGFYLSGGLDSSMLVCTARELEPGASPYTFSMRFADDTVDESRFQRVVSEHAGTRHHEVSWETGDLGRYLARVVYHAEQPLKEAYNVASYRLSQATAAAGVRVVLNGEGSDELFAGYPGYRFDQMRRARARRAGAARSPGHVVWGGEDIHYDRDLGAVAESKRALYAPEVRARLPEFDCLTRELVDTDRIRGRDPVHQRSYLDFKLRLAGHLIADHGDRMTMANSVEGRFPFLDRALVEFAAEMPPELKLHPTTEKYVLKKAAEGIVPAPVVNREKFAFVAPGSPTLLRSGEAWVSDALSPERTRRQGVFDPIAVERLRARYAEPGFAINPVFEDDPMIFVLTFSLFMDEFGLSPS